MYGWCLPYDSINCVTGTLALSLFKFGYDIGQAVRVQVTYQ